MTRSKYTNTNKQSPLHSQIFFFYHAWAASCDSRNFIKFTYRTRYDFIFQFCAVNDTILFALWQSQMVFSSLINLYMRWNGQQSKTTRSSFKLLDTIKQCVIVNCEPIFFVLTCASFIRWTILVFKLLNKTNLWTCIF